MKKGLFALLTIVALLAFGYTSSARAAVNLYGPHQVSQFIGKEVRGVNGQTLGTIQDFVTDGNGNLQYALLSSSHEPGRLAAVPVDALNFDVNMQYFSLNMTPDQLANAPVFSLNNLSNPAWNERVSRYYGIPGRYGMNSYREQQGRYSPGRTASNPPDYELWRDLVSPSRYGIALPWGEDGQTAFQALGPGNWMTYQERNLPQQGTPDQKYHNQALEYQGTSNPGQQGLWDPRDQWPF